jgi:Mg-chelatase subunit ChlD
LYDNLNITTKVHSHYAITEIAASFRTGDESELVTFEMDVPKNAIITGFKMIINGATTCTATVEEIKEARGRFGDALIDNFNAAITEVVSFGDLQKFNTKVNIQANSSGVFLLSYEASVERPHGDINQKYEVNMPIYTVVYTNVLVTIDVNEDFHISKPSVENTVELVYHQRDAGFNNEIQVEDQRILKTVIKKKNNNWIFHIKCTLDRGPEGDNCQQSEYGETNCYTGLRGKFNLKYDVIKRKRQLETFVTQHDVAAFISQNPNLNGNTAVHLIILMDTSGSMSENNKLRYSLDAVADHVLGNLKTSDKISLIEFDTVVSFLGEFYGTKRDRRKARKKLENVAANGWTNMNDALLMAIDIGNKHVKDGSESVPVIIVYSDGTPAGNGNIETNKNIIKNNVKENNSGCFPIYSMGIGGDADMEFLQELSSENCGGSYDLTDSSENLVYDLETIYGFLERPIYSRNVQLTINSTCIQQDSLDSDLDLLDGIRFIKPTFESSIELANVRFDPTISKDTACEVKIRYTGVVQNKPVEEAVKYCFPNGRSGRHQKIRVNQTCPTTISSFRQSKATPTTPFITRLRQYKKLKKQTEHIWSLSDTEIQQLAQEAKEAKFVIADLTALIAVDNQNDQCIFENNKVSIALAEIPAREIPPCREYCYEMQHYSTDMRGCLLRIYERTHFRE